MFSPAAKPSEPDDDGPRGPSEDEKLLSWAEEQFRALGFNEFQSAALADARVSWHDAEALIRRGCDVETALDLLL